MHQLASGFALVLFAAKDQHFVRACWEAAQARSGIKLVFHAGPPACENL
jgi:hypothetical protein